VLLQAQVDEASEQIVCEPVRERQRFGEAALADGAQL